MHDVWRRSDLKIIPYAGKKYGEIDLLDLIDVQFLTV